MEGAGAYGYDCEHGVSPGVSEQDVDEGDDLQRLAEAHAVGQNTAEPTAVAEVLHRLNQVVVQETDPADLKAEGNETVRPNTCKRMKARWCRYLVRFDGSGQLRQQENVLLLGRMVQVDQHPALGVRVVEGVIGVCAARLALLSSGRPSAGERVVLAGAQTDHICGAFGEGEEQAHMDQYVHDTLQMVTKSIK